MTDTDLNHLKIRPSSTKPSSPSLTRLAPRPPCCHPPFSAALRVARKSSAWTAVQRQGKALPWKNPFVFPLNTWPHRLHDILFLCLMRGNFHSENAVQSEPSRPPPCPAPAAGRAGAPGSATLQCRGCHLLAARPAGRPRPAGPGLEMPPLGGKNNDKTLVRSSKGKLTWSRLIPSFIYQNTPVYV